MYLDLIKQLGDSALAVAGYEREKLVKQIRSRSNASIMQQIDDLVGYVIFRLSMFCGLVFLLNIRRKRRFPPTAFLD